MKTKFLRLLNLSIFAALLYACTGEQVNPDMTPEAEATKNVALSVGGFSNTAFQLSMAFRKDNGGFGGGRIDQGGRVADVNSCGLFSFSENPDNSWTAKMDFGQGCWDGDTFKKGIVSITGKSTSNTTGLYKITFENFYERKDGQKAEEVATANGFYESTWEVRMEQLEDTTDHVYTEAIKAELQLKGENGANGNLKASGNRVSNIEGTTVTKYEFSGKSTKGDTFAGKVTKPLFWSLACVGKIYIEGTEQIDVNGKSFTLDYGDGACDNIFTISQAGVLVTVDLDKTE